MGGKDNRGFLSPPHSFLIDPGIDIGRDEFTQQFYAGSQHDVLPLPTQSQQHGQFQGWYDNTKQKKPNTTLSFQRTCVFCLCITLDEKDGGFVIWPLACYQELLSHSSAHHPAWAFGAWLCASPPAGILIWDCMPAKMGKESKRQLVEKEEEKHEEEDSSSGGRTPLRTSNKLAD